ncbi:MAG: 4Fe-4S binding protein [Clostridia bacterium]|nr:4Fe-4S binding protein [Clostridia bacterium]
MRSVSARDPNLCTIRLRVPLGIIYPEQLDTLKEVANRYGDGRLHLTTRKTVEIPGVPINLFNAAQALLAKAGWYANAFGNNVRNITACPGRYSCPNAQVDTQGIGLELDSAFFYLENLPAKLKIAVAGCLNGCTHPLVNDIGIVGVAPITFYEDNCRHCLKCIKSCREGAIKQNLQGEIYIDQEKCIDCGDCLTVCKNSALVCEGKNYRVYVGGKLGRHPQFGRFLGDFATQLEVVEQVERIIDVYCNYARKDERLGNMVERISMEQFQQLLERWQPVTHYDCAK